MRVLITGVAGHLGSRFAHWLLEHVPGVEIIGIDDLSWGYRENVPLGVRFIQRDLLLAWGGAVDYVFHFAAFASEGLSPFVRRYCLKNTAEITTCLINAVIRSGGCRRFVFTSSMAVYGRGAAPFAEDAHCRPIDPYGAAKLLSETDLQIAGEQHGLPWTIIRPHNVYGPGQNLWAKYRNVLGLWMRAAIEGKPLRVYGDGLQRRAFSYIDDILPCLWAAATRDEAQGEIINLGGESPVTILEAAETLRDVIGPNVRLEHCQGRHEVREAWCTVDRSRRLLDYADRTPLSVGISKMWHWSQEAWDRYPERRVEPPLEIEVPQGLYEYWQA